jgi:signal transduction histidine kinase
MSQNGRHSEPSQQERLAVIGKAAATFAHEAGNLLHSLSLAVELLEVELMSRAELVDDWCAMPLRHLKQHTTHLMALLREFRMVSAHQRCSLRPTSVAVVVSDLLATAARYYAARGIQVEQMVSPDLPLVAADSKKLTQALLNLCNNAVEAMSPGGTLTIHAYAAHPGVSVEITDTGMGLPDGVDIFSPFTTTKPHGVGLGLTIVQQIVAAHQGVLTYRSTPGGGTTFRIALLLSQDAGNS